jgi:hypothetical protein
MRGKNVHARVSTRYRPCEGPTSQPGGRVGRHENSGGRPVREGAGVSGRHRPTHLLEHCNQKRWDQTQSVSVTGTVLVQFWLEPTVLQL